MKNLAGDAAHAEQLARLKEELKKQLEQTGAGRSEGAGTGGTRVPQ